MPSDYQAITEENIVELGRGFERIGNFLAEKLYGDRSHFIYELLQNAEDALSLRRQQEPDGDFSGDVRFELCRDHLEVSHYGKFFDDEDVRAICDVLRGTKNERLDQIGTFGIGFKSVYAFTRSPEVHSGDEHFVIEQFIRPRGVPPRQLKNSTQTLFYFPFDHPEFDAEAAFELIGNRLKLLGSRSLLFLHHVKSLLWSAEGVGEGLYIRESQPSQEGGARVYIIGESTNLDDTEEEWLLLQRDVQHPTRPEKLPVKLAYKTHSGHDGKSIQALSRSPLTAFFPTARETGLGFLVHGPFEPTPARDNIQSDSAWNDLLLSELATLVADSLTICQRHGLLTADFLGMLPIETEIFPEGSCFRPIYDAVLHAFRNQPLIPTTEGGHARAREVVLGRSQELRELLPSDYLRDLLGKESDRLWWVDPSVTENRLPKVWQYLRDECEVPVIDGETLARKITTEFLCLRNDEWMNRFYAFLTGQEALWRAKVTYGHPPEGPLRKKPFIRCEDGQHRPPFDPSGRPVVFLPVDSCTNCHIVSRPIYHNEEAAEFFHRLGLVAPDICTTVLDIILPLYGEDCEIGYNDHATHLLTIRDAMRLNDSPRYAEMVKGLRSVTWVLARNAANGQEHYNRPPDLFMPLPELEHFFEANDNVWFLAEQDEDIDWQMLGIRSQPVVKCRGLNAGRHGYVKLCFYHGWHKRGYDGFDPDTSIDGLEHALTTITIEKAAYIWNELLPPLVRFLHGKYQEATHQNYDNATTHESDSRLCATLKEHAWIPVRDGEFKRPCDCTIADLAGELKRNEDLARAVGIQPDPERVAEEGQQVQETLITQAGFSREVAALLVQNRDTLTPEFIAEIIATQASASANAPEFPSRPVPDPERRVAGVRNRTRKADPKTYDKRKRSVRATKPQVSPKDWLRGMYTNTQGIMVCQICHKAMPFRIPTTGEYYFEAVQIADNFDKEEHCLYLALCPLCAAKYSVLVKKNDDRLSELIWAFEQTHMEDLAVPVQLDSVTASVRFVEAHLLDIKAALSECLI